MTVDALNVLKWTVIVSRPDSHEFFNLLWTELKYDACDCNQTQEDCDYSFHLFKLISFLHFMSPK